MMLILLSVASLLPSQPKPAQVRMAMLQGGTQNVLTLTVTPPAPAAQYSVTCTYDVVNGHPAWYGTLPNGAKAPIAATKVMVFPWRVLGMGVVVFPTLPDGSPDYSKIGCQIAFTPGAGNADLGGGIIMHNPSPSISAGPTPIAIAGGVTKGYSFTVGP